MERGSSNRTTKNVYHMFFTAECQIRCTSLKTQLQSHLNRPVECIFLRDPYEILFCKSGYLKVIGHPPIIQEVMIDLHKVQIFWTPEANFVKEQEEQAKKIYFELPAEFAREPLLSDYLSQFGQVLSLQIPQVSNFEEKKPTLKVQGHAVYSRAEQVRPLRTHCRSTLSFLQLLDFGERMIDTECFKLKTRAAGLPKPKNPKTAQDPKILDTRSKLDFTKHTHMSSKSHAFNGFYIRPYIRSTKAIISNSSNSSNLRMNLLSMNTTRKLLETIHSESSASPKRCWLKKN